LITGASLAPMSATAFAAEIGKAASYGSNPLERLTVIGHGSPAQATQSTSVGSNEFGVNSLASMIGSASARSPTTFDQAAAGGFPPLCWFRHDATVNLVGCNTKTSAVPSWAKGTLRKGAKAYGATDVIWVDVKGDGSVVAWYGNARNTVFTTEAQLYADSHWQSEEGKN
jgi:hypothetical protein